MVSSDKIVGTGDLGASLRTIGGILGQFDAFGFNRETSLQVLRGIGLPPIAYEDPTFLISLEQDFQLLNEIRKFLPASMTLETALFRQMLGARANMFGALGLAWQSAPTIRDAFKALITFPQANWGRSRVLLAVSAKQERIIYQLDKQRLPFHSSEAASASHKFALLLDLIAGVAVTLDIVQDQSLLKRVELTYEQPFDWHSIENELPYEVKFDADDNAAVYQSGFLNQVPKHSHEVSFRLAMKLVGRESAMLTEDISLQDRVVRWLWAASPPLSKPEIAKLLGVSERTFTRQLSREGTTFSQLLASVQSQRSENLLENRNLTVSEVAYRMGYADPAAFTRAFTSWQGLTPSEWRRSRT